MREETRGKNAANECLKMLTIGSLIFSTRSIPMRNLERRSRRNFKEWNATKSMIKNKLIYRIKIQNSIKFLLVAIE